MAEEDEDDEENDGEEDGGIMGMGSDYGSKLPDIRKK
jgi:hypothetical protein